jgi:hypothetical protein
MKICHALAVDLAAATLMRLVRILVSTESPLLKAVNQTEPATGELNLKK